MAGTLVLLNKNEQKKRALQIITGQTLSEINQSKNVDPNKRRANMAKRLQKDDDGSKEKKISHIQSMLRQAGWGDVPVSKFWIFWVKTQTEN